MRQIPVDMERLGSPLFLGCDPKMGRDDGANEVQKKDRDGRLLWSVQTLIRPEQGPAEVLTVTVPASVAPSFEAMTPVHFEDMAALPWSMGTRSGVSFSGASVSSVGVRQASGPGKD